SEWPERRPAARAQRAGRPHARAARAGHQHVPEDAGAMMRSCVGSAVSRHLPLAFAAAVAVGVSFAATPARAQEHSAQTGIGGTWTISFSAGGNPGQTENTRLQQSEPPLKPEYRAVWQARQAAAREADARGEPLATSATFCLPQGMPSMMGGGGPFPT